jgi:predicted RNase H-like HicB family nuclease
MAGKLRFTIILRREEGGYSAQCLEFPGYICEGETREVALENIKEAIRGYFEAFPEEAEKIKEEKELVEIVV